MVRRLQAEEAARETAVANLAAWVERAIRSLSARIDDVRSLVDGQTLQFSTHSAHSAVSDAPESRALELECMKELQAVRDALLDSHEQQEQCVKELAEKYKELKTAHAASCVEQGQALQHLSETHLEIKAAHSAAAVEQQHALRRLSQEVADALSASKERKDTGEQLNSLGDLGTPKDAAYRSCVIREPESAKSRESLGSRDTRSRLDAEDSKLVGHVANEVRRLSDDVLLCKAASEESRRVITEECFKFGARLTQLELEFRSRGSMMVPVSGALFAAPASELRASSPRQTWARGSSPARAEPVMMSSRSYGRLPGAGPPPSARSPALSHTSSTPSLLSQMPHVAWG